LNGSPEFEIENYNSAAESLLRLIRGERYASRSASSRRQRAVTRLSRVRVMLEALDDPQRDYPVVHVTGTSGKGSTAAAVAAILTAAGYRVGLRTSPYLQVPTEKLQVGTSLIDAGSFAEAVTLVLDTADRLVPPGQAVPPISYAEVWSVLGYWWFAKRKVDFAVVEVGSGGRFDATNAIDPVVSVITSVGRDHLVTLGPTIADIAWHKAGIIKPGATAVVGDLPAEALSIIAKEARSASVDVIRAQEPEPSRPRVPPVTRGFRERNADVATAVAMVLRQRGFAISEAAIGAGIASARLPGRLEQMPGTLDPAVWIDGAHNEDKIAALTAETARLFGGGPPPVIVFGMLSSKDPMPLLAKLGSAASSVVLTEPVVVGRESLTLDALANALTSAGHGGAIHIEPDPEGAVRFAEGVARREGAPVLVTGSMYLAGQVRRRWFRDQDVVLQRTPWPTPIAENSLGPPRAFGGFVRDKANDERDQPADHQIPAGAEELVIR
jgi:dihydrofolate synthase / folylpolyglutamate synthase